MKNLIIISPGILPVPATEGGAIENLIQNFINQNEYEKRVKIHLFSIYSKEAYKKSLKYKYCKFYFIEIDRYKYKLSRYTRYLINRFSKNYYGNAYINEVVKKLRNIKKIDRILIENKPEYSIILMKYGFENINLHLHNDLINSDTKHSDKILSYNNKIITVSKFIANRVNSVKEYTNIDVVYNGINLETFTKNIEVKKKIDIMNKYNISEEDRIIIYSGRITKEKGVKELILAFNKLNEKFKNIKLLIIGGISYSNNSSNKFFEEIKGISNNNVIFTGYIDYDEINKLYSLGYFGVVPSIGIDAAPLSTIELLVSKMPVIVSSSGGIKELIDEKCGLVVNIDDEYIENLAKNMTKLLLDNELRSNMSYFAYKRGQRYSILNYYNNLISKLIY
ncbi:glycosyltransferase family 4 protein [Clostridium perfringens]|uniref:glycosyltransferase family 4 protein n=1 Tax=Clostridium perfringens TaxID=1502 RepID=UPI0018D5BBB0|nr:glycosyltransferase family 4 protein [Clostridium perfringens]QPS30458.1 glycosyltransferase family 4 protein [Clostridium perfringens]STB42971.1 group 1 glycosyl transferase [Clostridium perfringens]